MAVGVQFFQPRTLQEAVSLLSAHAPEARPLAGGTDLVVHARGGRDPLPGALVHLGRIPGLNAIAVDDAGVLHLGAMASHADVESSAAIQRGWTALSDASAIVGSPATRHVGTVGGNLCNGSPAMEIGGPLLAFDASVRLLGPGGERSGSAYLRLEFRRAMEIAIVGVSAAVRLDAGGAIADCRIALTAVAPVIVRAPEAEQALRGAVGGSENTALLEEAGALAAAASAPIDDVRSPAGYRREMVNVLTVRALRRALERVRTE
jgi:CO/xanthine dehydrogenase FAD-binding subunit